MYTTLGSGLSLESSKWFIVGMRLLQDVAGCMVLMWQGRGQPLSATSEPPFAKLCGITTDATATYYSMRRPPVRTSPLPVPVIVAAALVLIVLLGWYGCDALGRGNSSAFTLQVPAFRDSTSVRSTLGSRNRWEPRSSNAAALSLGPGSIPVSEGAAGPHATSSHAPRHATDPTARHGNAGKTSMLLPWGRHALMGVALAVGALATALLHCKHHRERPGMPQQVALLGVSGQKEPASASEGASRGAAATSSASSTTAYAGMIPPPPPRPSISSKAGSCSLSEPTITTQVDSCCQGRPPRPVTWFGRTDFVLGRSIFKSAFTAHFVWEIKGGLW